MKLHLKRAQRDGGLMGGKVIFSVQARIDPTAEERALIKRYKLGKTTVYNSQEAQKHATAAVAETKAGTFSGLAKSAIRMGMYALSLHCTIESLCDGQTIECKDMAELLSAEEAIHQACATTKMFLQTAATFDGREMVMEF